MRICSAGSVMAVAAMTVAVSSVASAQTSASVARAAAHEATVLQIDVDGMLVDVGNRAISARGDRFEIYRPIVVRHPVSGRAIHDRFMIGTVRITAPGNTLSIAHADGALTREAAVGDILVPVVEPEPVEAAPAAVGPAPAEPDRPSEVPRALEPVAAPPPSSQPDRTTIEERAAVAVWMETLGRTPEDRIAIYERYVSSRPLSPFAARVRREIHEFRAMTLVRAQRRARENLALPQVQRPALRGSPATTLNEGDPAIMAFQLDPNAGVRAAVLHVRRFGSSEYESVLLASDGDGYLRTRLPPQWVRTPGYEYFIEVVRADGRADPAIGSPREPRRVEVIANTTPVTNSAGRSRIDLRTEYADAGSTAGRPERFAQMEGDFLQRVRWGALYGLRVGFGVYDSVGQPLCAYEARCSGAVADPATQHSNVVYGYQEFEFEAAELLHLTARLELGTQGAGSTNATGGLVGGFQARIRIGRERATNLLIGGDLFGQVGQRAFFAFNLFPIPRLNVLTQGEVFNQAVDQGDPMFRLISQLGYRVTPWAVVSLRGSYQLRNVNHGGFGAGLAVTFDW